MEISSSEKQRQYLITKLPDAQMCHWEFLHVHFYVHVYMYMYVHVEMWVCGAPLISQSALTRSQVLLAKLEKSGKHMSAEEKSEIMKVRSLASGTKVYVYIQCAYTGLHIGSGRGEGEIPHPSPLSSDQTTCFVLQVLLI